jgi:hypothetical protein
MKKPVGRPKGTVKGRKKIPITTMLKIDEVMQKGGEQKAKELIAKYFSKL